VFVFGNIKFKAMEIKNIKSERMNQMKFKTKLTAIMLTIAMLIAITPMTAFTAESGNLLVNPSFESGLSGWTDPDGNWDTVKAESSFVAQDGEYFAWPKKGPGTGAPPQTSIYQDVSLSGYGSGQTVTLSGMLCNWDQSPNDQATLILEFLNSAGSVLSTSQREQRDPKWTRHLITAMIPAGAATVRVRLLSTRYVGSDNDGYFDDLSLTISNTKVALVYITGPTNLANTGDAIQLTATNGTSSRASDFEWSTSYSAVATVDANGLVTFIGKSSDEVTIYAKDKATGVTGSYRFNSDIVNEAPAPTAPETAFHSSFIPV
jgi:hypothetical protein